MTILVPALLLMLALLVSPATAQAEALQGSPLLRHYDSEDYQATPQHTGLTTDREGRLYVGNAEGVLRYDGNLWQLIELPGRAAVRNVVAGRDGNIYVGSYDTFGWLQPTADGGSVYRELLTAVGLKGRERAIGNVWQVIPVSDGIYFRTTAALHFLRYDRSAVRRWPLGEDQRVMWAIGDRLYARVDGKGFGRLVDGRFQLEPGGGIFARQAVLGVIPQPGGLLLVGRDRFHRADRGGITPLAGDAGGELRDQQPYVVRALADDSFVVGTLGGDIFRYGVDGRLRDRLHLGNFGILALGSDPEGGLWAATEGDLVRMSFPSPWSFLGPENGLDGSVYDFAWHDDALWVATSRGLQRMRASGDGRVDTTSMQWPEFDVFALAATDSGLLVAHRDGLLVLDPGAGQPRILLDSESESVLELLVSGFDRDIVYALGDRQLLVLRRRDGRWQIEFKLPLAGASAATLLETASGELWFADSRGGPQRWTLDLQRRTLLRRQVFGGSDGLLLDPRFRSNVFLLDGNVHVVSGGRGFRYAATGFVPHDGAPLDLVDRPDELLVEDTPLGTYAFSQRQLLFRARGEAGWNPLRPGSPQAAGYGVLRFNRDGVVRIATWNGLLQFDPDERQQEPPPRVLRLELASTEAADESGRVTHLGSVPGRALEVPAGHLLRVRHAIVGLDGKPEYRHRLAGPGAAAEWSSWGDGERVLASATPGDFLLTVEARTAAGRTAAATALRYRVLPHWHQQWWMRALGALLLIGLMALATREFVRRRILRYQRANRVLETRIGERTRELEKLNRQLVELATEDALTGVANRRAMQNGLDREWIRCMDHHAPLSVLMVDVDHFKRYNDTHGHLEGDAMLRLIAQNLQALHDPARELLARFGGEEFALMLPGVPQADALQRAEAIRAGMQQRIGGITISIGVAGFVPSAERDPVDLLRLADGALYRAKHAGRNRVEGAVDSPVALPA